MNDTGAIVLALFGRVLQAAGALIVLLAGACALLFSGIGLSSQPIRSLGTALGVLFLTVPLGLIGAAPGIGLFLLGRLIVRRAKAPPTP